MAPDKIIIKVEVLYPENVTLKMVAGAFLAWIFKNVRFLLKFGWKVTVKDGEYNEF